MMRVVCGVMCGMNADVRPCATMWVKTRTTLKTCDFPCKNNRYHPAIHSFNQRVPEIRATLGFDVKPLWGCLTRVV